MKELLAYLNSLLPSDQADYAKRSGTTVGYLRKACSQKQRLGADLCIELERESKSVVRCEDLRPDVDWGYLRASGCETSKVDAGGTVVSHG